MLSQQTLLLRKSLIKANILNSFDKQNAGEPLLLTAEQLQKAIDTLDLQVYTEAGLNKYKEELKKAIYDNKDLLEKAVTGKHWHLEGGKRVYYYAKMSAEQHEEAMNFHEEEGAKHDKLSYPALNSRTGQPTDVSRAKANENKKLARHHEGEYEKHEKLAKEKSEKEDTRSPDDKFNDELIPSLEEDAKKTKIKKSEEDTILEELQKADRMVGELIKIHKIGENGNLQALFVRQDLEKGGVHKLHKYVSIKNGKYIYDYDKMSHNEHKEAAELHHKKGDGYMDDAKEMSENGQEKNIVEGAEKLASEHRKEAQKHEKLAKEKGEKKEKGYIKHPGYAKTTLEEDLKD